ncbi:MAG: HAMP domain-containing histidine kinase [Eggerthellaceae bacterium]|nr:HAMP domain-containing histidine kinase [Eggerthellaceae bacterium]
MTPQAIAKMRRTFIAIATASFFVAILFMGVTTFASNVIVVRSQANNTIDAILDAGGNVPTRENYHGEGFQEEASYGLRFFTVSFDNKGNVIDIDVSHVNLIGKEEAIAVSEVAADPDRIVGLGQYENYMYKEGPTENGSMVVFLDCSFQLENVNKVTTNTLILTVLALVVAFIAVFAFSKRAIKSEIENANRQQKFMTNASHELKTPIAVIRANTELTEMLSGETEWTQSTLNQVDRLEGLVRDLMTIVRGEERESAEQQLSDIDVAAVVGKAVDSFKGMAQQNGKNLETSLADGVKLRGSEASIEQLTCLFVDNAIKYCDEGGSIDVSLSPGLLGLLGHGCTLSVTNDYAEGADVDYRRFFDRFYRADESHENQQGYGIGLSVAESICERYHGSIKASWKAGKITFTCVLKDA